MIEWPYSGVAGKVSVFQITMSILYIIGGVLLGMTRLQANASQENMLLLTGLVTAATGLLWHAWTLWLLVFLPDGMVLSIGNTVSLIGFQLALVAIIATAESTLRGLCGGLLILAGLGAFLTGGQLPVEAPISMSLQVQTHVLISLFAYGLLTVGAIVAIYALIQDRRLRRRVFSSTNQLFAPMETTEQLLFGINTAGFLLLLLAVSSGFAFVENLFAQHLVHKTTLSLLALTLFGLLLAGRRFAGWRGRRAIYLYLGGFVILCLAYFGSRYILEELLGRSWS